MKTSQMLVIAAGLGVVAWYMLRKPPLPAGTPVTFMPANAQPYIVKVGMVAFEPMPSAIGDIFAANGQSWKLSQDEASNWLAYPIS